MSKLDIQVINDDCLADSISLRCGQFARTHTQEANLTHIYPKSFSTWGHITDDENNKWDQDLSDIQRNRRTIAFPLCAKFGVIFPSSSSRDLSRLEKHLTSSIRLFSSGTSKTYENGQNCHNHCHNKQHLKCLTSYHKLRKDILHYLDSREDIDEYIVVFACWNFFPHVTANSGDAHCLFVVCPEPDCIKDGLVDIFMDAAEFDLNIITHKGRIRNLAKQTRISVVKDPLYVPTDDDSESESDSDGGRLSTVKQKFNRSQAKLAHLELTNVNMTSSAQLTKNHKACAKDYCGSQTKLKSTYQANMHEYTKRINAGSCLSSPITNKVGTLGGYVTDCSGRTWGITSAHVVNYTSNMCIMSPSEYCLRCNYFQKQCDMDAALRIANAASSRNDIDYTGAFETWKLKKEQTIQVGKILEDKERYLLGHCKVVQYGIFGDKTKEGHSVHHLIDVALIDVDVARTGINILNTKNFEKQQKNTYLSSIKPRTNQLHKCAEVVRIGGPISGFVLPTLADIKQRITVNDSVKGPIKQTIKTQEYCIVPNMCDNKHFNQTFAGDGDSGSMIVTIKRDDDDNIRGFETTGILTSGVDTEEGINLSFATSWDILVRAVREGSGIDLGSGCKAERGDREDKTVRARACVVCGSRFHSLLKCPDKDNVNHLDNIK